MNKQHILDNVDNLTAEQLYSCISQGIVSLDELKKTGNLDASKRAAIQKLQSKHDSEDDAAWEECRYGNETGLADYISTHPKGRHVNEAKQRMDDLRQERENIRAQKQDILDKIRRNSNAYYPSQILEYLSNGTLTQSELKNCGIPQTVIDNLDKVETPRLQIGETPDEIPSGYTEVYFWGGTGSGKTCALGAVLQMAEEKGYLNIAPGPGCLYATQLKNIFSDDDVANDYLPAPSPLETTQYLPFTLKRPNEKHSRSVSLIELSGEIFKCFFHKNAGQQLPTLSHENTFNSLNNFLKSNNRKIHFFFIDYDEKNAPDGDGLKQSDYLAAASTYFKNNAVFGKTTDAIYVVLTKSDLLTDELGKKVPPEKRVEYAKKHLSAKSFTSFINTLKDNCKKYSINAGKLTVEPFSLGGVYFQQICNFEGSSAERILEILMDRIEVSKKSILDILNQ
ncbi:MAG: hypothetical protein LBP83_07955 [Dysgonamonadaceae bacterium]|jgi:hypothetical protein|nr:hypothetical protein [Dysgonamonadaceae bacterium]